MKTSLRILLCLAILFAPGCQMVDSLTGLTAAEEEAEASRLEAESLQRQLEVLQTASDLAEAEVGALRSRLATATIALEDATAAALSPEDLAAFEDAVAELEGKVAVAALDLAESQAALEDSRRRTASAQIEAARDRGRADALQEQFENQGQAVTAGATIAGGPAGGSIAQAILAIGMSGGLAFGRIRGATKSLRS